VGGKAGKQMQMAGSPSGGQWNVAGEVDGKGCRGEGSWWQSVTMLMDATGTCCEECEGACIEAVMSSR
jgi:hypothetical protein